jgi:hypothetical protein
MRLTIPNRNIIASAAIMDNPAPDSDASVKSLGIFLQHQNHQTLYCNIQKKETKKENL